jgi:hypothetical protein
VLQLKYKIMKLIVLLIFFVLHVFVFGQNSEIIWQQCYGGSENDNAIDILGKDDGYIIAGWTSSDDGDVLFNHGLSDGWIIKTDTIGNINWEKTYGGTLGDNIRGIIPSDGEYFLLGASNSSDGDISNDPYPNTWDYWIVKIDNSGNIIWEKIVGGNGDEVMWSGTPTSDGGVVALGWTGSTDGDITINYGAYDMWMVKINSDGEKEWDLSIGTNDFDYGHAIIQTSDGGFLVGGTSTLGEGGNLTCEPYNDNGEAILVKLDADRNIEWQQCYGGSGHDAVLALLELEDGYLFSGYGSSDDGDLTGSGWHGESDVWIVKIDFYGNIIWQKCFGGSNGEMGKNLFKTENNGFVAVVNTYSNDGDVTGNHSSSEYDSDIWILKLDSDGELLWQQCFGGEGKDRVDFGVIKKSDNNFVIAGETDYGPSYDVACTPHGGNGIDRDLWVFEIQDTTSVGLHEILPKNSEILVYPNPAKDYVIFEIKGSKIKGNILIKDIFGQQIAELPIKNQKSKIINQKKVWDTRKIKSGVYFYTLNASGFNKFGKIVISK